MLASYRDIESQGIQADAGQDSQEQDDRDDLPEQITTLEIREVDGALGIVPLTFETTAVGAW
jgi:hypothetical protein